MPFKSLQQVKFMYAKHPEIAKRWSKETKSTKKLPKRVSKEMPDKDMRKMMLERMKEKTK